MKLIANRPIYVNGAVVIDGHPFETQDQHGRELIRKGYATLIAGSQPEQQEQEQEQEQEKEQPAETTGKKGKK
jgi:hypothetical protein